MATFHICLDKRNTKRQEKHPLAVRICEKRKVLYLRLPGLEWTEKEFKRVFNKRGIDANTEAIKTSLAKYTERAKQVFFVVEPFDSSRIRALFYDKTFDPTKTYSSKREVTDDLASLYEAYIQAQLKSSAISASTASTYRYNLRSFISFQPGLKYTDITPEFLSKFERWYLSRTNKKGLPNSLASAGSVIRSLRAVLKYHMRKKNLPSAYEYPFVEYTIPSHSPPKKVISVAEIQKIVDMPEFTDPYQEYVRDVWLLLYRMNGINFIDLLKLRWSDIKGKYIIFRRHKTIRTRRHNIRDVKVFITPKIQSLLDKIGDKESPFILGLMNKENYDEIYLNNRNHKLKIKINKCLHEIGMLLEISLPLDISMARDAYANTMKRGGKSIELIAEQMNHASILTTQRHYLDSYDDDTIDSANDVIL